MKGRSKNKYVNQIHFFEPETKLVLDLTTEQNYDLVALCFLFQSNL